MISKNQLKKLRGMTDLEISARLGVKPSEVFEARRRYGLLTDKERTHVSKTKRKLIIGGSLLTLTVIGGGVYLLRSPNYNKEIPKNVEIESLSPLEKFTRLPQTEQEAVLSHLEHFVIERTDIGKHAKDISERVKVKEVYIPTLSGGVERYGTFGNVIYFGQKTWHDQIKYYLAGSFPLSARAHEKLHFIHDTSSRWDQFETLFKDKNRPSLFRGTEELTEIGFTAKEVIRFMKNWYGKPNIQPDKAISDFLKLIPEYNSTIDRKRLIEEVHAYLFFWPFTSDGLYQAFNQQPEYKRFIEKVSPEGFARIFRGTLELIALLEPIEAAKFVGQHNDTPEKYLDGIQRLKSKMGILDAVTIGLERQRRLAAEVEAIKREALNYIDQKYAILTDNIN